MSAIEIKKFLIECGENYTVKTYELQNENFVKLKLRGGEIYRLNQKNLQDYWRQWEQESGYTPEDFADICIIWRDDLDLKSFFEASKIINIKNISPCTWTQIEVESFFSFTNRPFKFKENFSLKRLMHINFSDGKKFFIGSLNMPCHVEKEILQKNTPPVSEKNEKIIASPSEIKNAFKELGKKHFNN